MKRVTLADSSGNTKEVVIRFSFGYLIFGPLYYLYKLMIVRGLLLLVMYGAIIYKKTPILIKEVLLKMGTRSDYLVFFDKIENLYWILLGVLLGIHVLLSFITPRAVIRKLYKKGYVPYSEIDTQMLIKFNLAKVGTLSYLSSFKAVDGIQGKITMGNSKNLKKELEELKELLKEGMISKDEYETKRAMAIMRRNN